MRLKEVIGSGLVIVGSGLAGAGFGKKDSKLALIGTFTMDLEHCSFQMLMLMQ